MDISEKQKKQIESIAANLQKRFAKKGDTEKVVKMGNEYEPVETFPTGCFELDEALGGGLPLGRIVEYYGAAGTGKTSLCYHAVCEFQKKYPSVPIAWIDAERAFDAGYMEQIGADPSTVYHLLPDNGNVAFDMIVGCLEEGIKLIIVDSVAALLPAENLEKDMTEELRMGSHARLMNRGLQLITPIASKNNATVIFINQTRDLVGAMTWGDKTTTTGGKSLGFYASVRVQFSKLGVVKDKDEGSKDNPVVDEARSVKTKAIVKKTRFCPPLREANFVITFGIGVDHEWSALNYAVNYGIVEKNGQFYAFKGENFGRGEQTAIEELRENRKLYHAILEEVDKKKAEVKAAKEAEAKRMRDLRLDIAKEETNKPKPEQDANSDE